ncbi:hypothetical protein H0H93_011511 [Arthromyces matolae]|nr:hypothetical protein H0H93_011511 [Arthromyces matolae]
MTSVAPSYTPTKSKRSTRHGKHTERRHAPPNALEKLVVKTAGLHLEPGRKTGSPRPEVPAETLPVMLGNRTRRSRCTPEFLLEISSRDPQELYEEHGKKLKIITGSEAIIFYKKFLGGNSTAEILGATDGVLASEVPPNVVFAVATGDSAGGRKHADYYAAWPRTESARDTVQAKRLKRLHSQFRKLARVLDNEFKRASVYGIAAPVLAQVLEDLLPTQAAPTPEHEAPKPPPSPQLSILPPPPELKIDGKSPVSATDSVMSLPYLDFVRNVPNAHRIPLRVTNPDNRLSVLSSVSPTTSAKPSQQVPVNNPLVTQDTTKYPTPTPFSTPAPAEKLLIPEVVLKSNSSIRSSRSKDSAKSSVASTVSKESHRGKNKAKEIPQFLMVLLDERIDKETRTWHGLERQMSRSSTKSASRVSLWDGPLARDTGRLLAYPPHPDEEESSDDDDDEWDNSPVIPPPPLFARSISEPRQFPPLIPPPLPGFRPPVSLSGSPIGSFTNLSYGPTGLPPGQMTYPSSAYAPSAYMSPFHSPGAPLIRTLSRNGYPPSFQQ